MPQLYESEHGRREETLLLPLGHKLIFAHFEMVPYIAAKDPHLNLNRDRQTLLGNTDLLMAEYKAILRPLIDHIGVENLALLRNVEISNEIGSPPDIDIETISARPLSKKVSSPWWPRDNSTTIEDFTFVHPEGIFSAATESDNVIRSYLGEGGTVLHAGKAVLVVEELWKLRKQDKAFPTLQERGFVVAPLPGVVAEKQVFPLAHNDGRVSHIDGHATLITDRQGCLRLLIARSYAYQGGKTLGNIQRAADTIGARITIVDDTNLPPLPLNLVQFNDGTIFATKTRDGSLEEALADSVGSEHVLTTEVPIVVLPKITYGSIRCMTNVVPQSFLRQLAA